ncbi:MAG: hypothetical protein ACR2QB_05925 [Gammaproteobacteria bacterium]
MTGYGKLNLAGMVMLPAAAVLGALICFGPRLDTLIAVAGINVIPMLLGGLVSGLLLRGANRVRAGQWIALWPTWIPAIMGTVWYLWRAVLPEEVAPQREYLAAPQYLLLGVIALTFVAWIGCRIARARQDPG